MQTKQNSAAPDSQENDEKAESDETALSGTDEGTLSLPTTDQVIIQKNDRSIFELKSWYSKGRLITDPEWQREFVWDNRRISKLVESFLMDIPIPVIYLAETQEGKWEVIDGVQRLTSIIKFIDNEVKLTGLERFRELEGQYFKDIPEHLQNKLNDVTLRTFELSKNTSKNLLFVIFERLNTGGVRLHEMEIRNCIFRGKLNDLIKDLSKNENFVKAANQNNLGRRMQDRGLVLRFLAFYKNSHLNVKSGLKAFLNDFFETYRNPSDPQLKEFREAFERASRLSFSVFGENAFRLRRRPGKSGGQWASRLNAPIFQATMVCFARADAQKVVRCSDRIYESYLDLVTNDQTWVDSVTKSTGDPQKIRYVFETWQRRLDSILSDDESNNPRIFSKSLKIELYKQCPTCKICGNEIKSIDDAAVDHIEEYWRGGKTIPENARLTHRSCNQERTRT